MARVLMALALGWLASGCSDEGDGARIDVAISELAPGLPMRLDRIELRVNRLDGSELLEVRSDATEADYATGTLRPWVVAVTPDRASDVGRTVYRFRAVGFASGRAYVAKQARTTFVAGQRFVLPLRFETACVDLACAADQTCSAGVCVSDVLECTDRGSEVVCTGPNAPPVDAATPAPPPGPPPPPPLDLGAPDLGPRDAGPSDMGADTIDARAACPLEAERSLDENQCNRSVAACILLDCMSGSNLDCVERCAADDGDDCLSCVQWNAVTCARAEGCDAEWSPLACCGDDHGCSEYSCARSDCPDEFDVFRDCADRIFDACNGDLMRCLQ